VAYQDRAHAGEGLVVRARNGIVERGATQLQMLEGFISFVAQRASGGRRPILIMEARHDRERIRDGLDHGARGPALNLA
jgi:hypothetical protein